MHIKGKSTMHAIACMRMTFLKYHCGMGNKNIDLIEIDKERVSTRALKNKVIKTIYDKKKELKS